MGRPYTGLTVNEGYTDIGTFDIEITDIEIKVEPSRGARVQPPQVSNARLFRLNCSDGEKISTKYRAQFGVSVDPSEAVMISQNPNSEGYIQINIPKLPIVKLPDAGVIKIIDMAVKGPLEDRDDECYLKVTAGEVTLYTLIKELVVYGGVLCVPDSLGHYFRLSPTIPVSSSVGAIYVSKKGQIYGYDEDSHAWGSLGTLTFYKIQLPQNLISSADGFYLPGSSGDILPGNLGSAFFPDSEASISNADVYNVNVELKVFNQDAGTPFHTQTFTDVMPGELNIINVSIPCEPEEDLSPTLADFEGLYSITLPTPFKTFLTTHGFNSFKSLRTAGPIKYIEGLPSVEESHLDKLQAHTDLYAVNADEVQNKFIMSKGYNNLYDIAKTPKHLFIEDITSSGSSIELFQAGLVHQVVYHNVGLATLKLAGLMVDMSHQYPKFPSVSGSKFLTEFFPPEAPCGCSDCQSVVSPFAYLMDLLKYCASHLRHTIAPIFTEGGSSSDLINTLTTVFIQPFGTLNVDCETLHDLHCRVRLVTEVLEKHVANKISASPPQLNAKKQTKLVSDRKQFLTYAYHSLLLQLGTSFSELRDVVHTPVADKAAANEKFAKKISLPAEVIDPNDASSPPTKRKISDRLWLTLTGSTIFQLTGTNLQLIFGFRNTQLVPVTTVMDKPYLYYWRTKWLDDEYFKEDYYFSDYSRETAPSLIKTSWKPIVDPDTIGWEDITYKPLQFASDLWVHRKKHIDAFLDYCIKSTVITSNVSSDIANRTVRVPGINITGHNIADNTVFISDGAGVPNWIDFEVYSKKAVESNSDIVLTKSVVGAPQNALFQPASLPGKMRYYKILKLEEDDVVPQTTSAFTVDFDDPVLTNYTGAAKLISDGSTDVYDTKLTGGAAYKLTATFTPGDKISLVLQSNNTAPTSLFAGGPVYLLLEIEVELFSDSILNPTKLVNAMFGVSAPPPNFQYANLVSAYTSPGLPLTFNYQVFVVPGAWPTGVTGATHYEKLKSLYQILAGGLGAEEHTDFISYNLSMKTSSFNRMIQLLISCEKYVASPLNAKRPSVEEQYELAGILWIAAKAILQLHWVKEEILQTVSSGGAAYVLSLNGQTFWKSIKEPTDGNWDGSLQTFPVAGAINYTVSKPIIDPDLISETELSNHPNAQVYVDLYEARKIILENILGNYLGWLVPHQPDGFDKIFNHINKGDETINYTITGYADLTGLNNDLNNTDVFKVQAAIDTLWSAFRISEIDFRVIWPIVEAYQSTNPEITPGVIQLKNAARILVSCYKRLQLWPSASPYQGWIDEERNGSGSLPGGTFPVRYFNVRKLKMAPSRGFSSNRSEWQKTLARWNRNPTINPDIVVPENIKNFSVSGTIYNSFWLPRKTVINGILASLSTVIDPALSNATLFANFKDQLDNLMARDLGTSSPAQLDYLHYFTDLKEWEANGVDIRPYLEQYGMTPQEYRYLAKIYNVLENGGAIETSEAKDVKDILLHVKLKTAGYYTMILAEFAGGILLSSGGFKQFSPSLVAFPQSTKFEFNQWRAPLSDRKDWLNTLDGRIERENALKTSWEESVSTVEDNTLPVMRDALILALSDDCESLDDAAERLAKTFFIETKDNCCVKHTRVSFAIETLQGLVFALSSGIYDEYATGFKLIAPDFKKEWAWLSSYASWRAAIFMYVYPENILYPTLKKIQSPAFRQLAERLTNSNRLTPAQACDEGKKFQSYFADMQTLEVVCTVNAFASYKAPSVDDCCGTSYTVQDKETSFFFAQADSGKCYWSFKNKWESNSNSLSFWEEMPIDRSDFKLVGVFVVSAHRDKDRNNIDLNLQAYYSYFEDGKLKMATIKKELKSFLSDWSQPEEIEDIPTQTPWRKDDETIAHEVCAAQQAYDFADPNFIVTCKAWYVENDEVKWYYKYNGYTLLKDNKWDIAIESTSSSVGWAPLIRSIHLISSSWVAYHVYVFESHICVMLKGHQQADIAANRSYTWSSPGLKIFAAYESQQEYNCIIVVGKNGANTEVHRILITSEKVTLTSTVPLTHNSMPPRQRPARPERMTNHYVVTYSEIHVKGTTSQLTNPTVDFSKIKKIAAIHRQSWSAGVTAIVLDSDEILSVDMTYDTVASSIGIDHILSIGLSRMNNLRVESAECCKDLPQRKNLIEQHMSKNLNTPEGNSSSTIQRSNSMRECLLEAYYFVPMLIALDQQRRGQYETALEWYRTIYDYAEHVATNRKIYHGLVLEDDINNTTAHDLDWLRDVMNPHLVAQTRPNAYSKYTIMNIIQCIVAYADREFTLDTVETVPRARKLYSHALELLKSEEMELINDPCNQTAGPCLSNVLVLPEDGSYDNLLETLQSVLGTIKDPEELADLIEDIKDIINVGGSPAESMTYDQRFAAAFALIPVTTPAAGASVAAAMGNLSTNMSNAYQYVFAFGNTGYFNSAVTDSYTTTVASISGLTVAEVSNVDYSGQIAWLAEPVKTIDSKYSFRFADESGNQLLKRSPFNPVVFADANNYNDNLVASNPNSFYGFHSEELSAYVYYPLINASFCRPINPVYKSLRMKANVELYKIFNCRNIAGMVRELDPYAAPTDSTSGIPVIGAGGSLSLPGIGKFPPSQYRFKVLLERAKQLTAQAQQLESLFLSAIEKEDAENYAQFRAKQDIETARASVKLQDARIHMANDERKLAQLQVDKSIFIRDHYSNLYESGLNAYEVSSLILLETAFAVQGVISGLYIAKAIAEAAAATALAASGVGASNAPIVTSAAMQSAIAAMQSGAGALSTQSSVLSTLASYQRRSEEWGFQKDVANLDIDIGNQQVSIANDNIRIVTQEKEIAQLNTEHAENTLEFLRSKFSNAELYNWMGNVLERSYSYILNLATSVARTAEGQLLFERQEQTNQIILNDYWETPSSGFNSGSTGDTPDRRGLTGSARLLVDITKLEQHAFDSNKRKLQMTKVVSLAANFPVEFQMFRETGVLNFELTDKLFNYDFPGHYMRLIKGVRTTVVGLIPTIDSIKATLTAASTSYTVLGGTVFQKIPIRRLELDSVALTSASNATGVFEMQSMEGELLNPFEGMGVESRWEFKMPQFTNRFDFSNIADVLVSIEYTALDSFLYRTQVLQDLDNEFKFSRGFSFKNDFPDQWYDLANQEEGSSEFSVEFNLDRRQFPQGLDDIRISGNIVCYFVREESFTDEIKGVDFQLASNTQITEGPQLETNIGRLPSDALMKFLTEDPFVRLKFRFDNLTYVNRELFKNGQIKDILLIIPCKGELRPYPL